MSNNKLGAILLLVAVGMVINFTTATPLHALADSATPQITTSRFQIFTDFDDKEALELAEYILQLHLYYNQIFNFDFELPDQKRLAIRYFATKQTFDSYLKRILGRTYSSFIFLDYEDSNTGELLIYSQPTDDFENSLAHFSFIQFIEAHVPTAPIWIREGYALYFGNSFFDTERNTVVFRENDEWLEKLKEIINEDRLIDFEQFFRFNEEQVRENRTVFYAQAWGLVNFLVSYRRRGMDYIIREINASLQPNASFEENINNTLRILQAYFDFPTAEKEFREYILKKESVDDLIATAIEHYHANRLEKAETALQNALGVEEHNPIPYYYLGLIHYSRSEPRNAQYYYLQALIRGAPEDTVYYALGLNALLSNDRLQAISYFDQAGTINPRLLYKIDEALEKTY